MTADQPGLEPLIPGPGEAGFEALRQRGLYPINHLIVIRDDLLDAHPDLAADVFAAFAEAKSRYVERIRRDEIQDPTPTDLMYKRVMAITGGDPLPYGIAPNRAMIEQLSGTPSASRSWTGRRTWRRCSRRALTT